LRYIYTLFFIIFITISSFTASWAGKGDIVSTRSGRHRDFHRLVIELRSKAKFSITSLAKSLEVRVVGIDSLGFRGGYAGTSFFKLQRISTVSKANVPVTTFFLRHKKTARIRYRSLQKPFRIIIDMYPQALSSGAVKASHRVKKSKSAKSAPKRTVYGGREHSALAFNKGWRWTFRKSTIKHLKEYYYSNIPSASIDKYSEYVHLREGLGRVEGMETLSYLKALTLGGYLNDAQTFQSIILFARNVITNTEAEQDLMEVPENAFTSMARFLIASYYEREGLYPEAIAYYGMAYNGRGSKKLKANAAIGRGRVLFFSGKVSESKKWFIKARKEGSRDAGAWLANVLFLKGEFSKAWSNYAKMDNLEDPLSLMGFADIKMMRGDFKGAGHIFKGLKTRFRGGEIMQPFFALREADTLLAAGSVKEALGAYVKIRSNSSPDGAAMAGLALADYYSYEGGEALKARDLYREVAGGKSIASGEALLRLADVLEGLKEHSEAMKALDDLFFGYPFLMGTEMMGFLRSKITYNWISDLYNSKKWLEVAIINYRYGNWVSYGKRAENFLRAGEALMKIGLTPDAVKTLIKAEKIGKKEIRVKAALILTRLYLDQRDFVSAKRLLDGIRGNLSGAALNSKWDDYYIEALYLKGNYKEVIRLGKGKKDGPMLLMRAGAYKGLSMWSDAKRLYLMAIAEYKKNHNRERLIEARTGYGDSLYHSGGFNSAIKAYGASVSMVSEDSHAAKRWAKYRLSLSYAGAGMGEKAVEAARALKKEDNSYGEWAEALTLAEIKGK